MFGTTGNRRMPMRTTGKPFSIDKKRMYLQSGQIQCGFGRCGWADDRAVRSRLAEQSLQALEQNELGKLLSTAGTRRLHSQKDWRSEDFRCAHCGRSCGPDGCQATH